MISPSIAAEINIEPFQSLTAMREAHANLIQERRHHELSSAFVHQVEIFLLRGAATGAYLDNRNERRAAQSMLDYWDNVISRLKTQPIDPTLADFDIALAPLLPDDLCPYLGLDAFQERDSQLFYGRQKLVRQLKQHLQSQRLLALVGPSGSGKSSTILAGLLPALRKKSWAEPQREEFDTQNWHYYPPFVPGSQPLTALACKICPDGEEKQQWAEQQRALFLAQADHLTALIEAQNDRPAVLIIDQFEEAFTLCLDTAEQKAFIDNLLYLTRNGGQRHTIFLTIRRDFESFVSRYPAFEAAFTEATVRIMPLSSAELREAIEKPAEKAGLKFEDGVVDALLQDILGEPAALPLLQFTLWKLWQNRERNRVSLATYQKLGGGRQALARSADDYYDNLVYEDQVTARRILLNMVCPGQGLEVTSRRIQKQTLFQTKAVAANTERVLDKLVEARLVRVTEGLSEADTQIEVAHEALIRNWPLLVEWVEEERETLRHRLRLTQAAEQWQEFERDNNLLWEGALLLEAAQLADLNPLEKAFIAASQEAVQLQLEREAAIQQREVKAQLRIRNLTIGILLIIVALIPLLFLIVFENDRANYEATNAEAALAGEATAAAGQATAGAAESTIEHFKVSIFVTNLALETKYALAAAGEAESTAALVAQIAENNDLRDTLATQTAVIGELLKQPDVTPPPPAMLPTPTPTSSPTATPTPTNTPTTIPAPTAVKIPNQCQLTEDIAKPGRDEDHNAAVQHFLFGYMVWLAATDNQLEADSESEGCIYVLYLDEEGKPADWEAYEDPAGNAPDPNATPFPSGSTIVGGFRQIWEDEKNRVADRLGTPLTNEIGYFMGVEVDNESETLTWRWEFAGEAVRNRAETFPFVLERDGDALNTWY